MNKILTIEELRLLAYKKVPKMFFDYLESGSWTENTIKKNKDDFNKIEFVQRVVRDISNRKLEVKVLNESLSFPIALAPCGLAGMQCANGEILAAKASEKFGVPFTLSTMSMTSIEDLAKYLSKPFWFQLYVMKDKKFVENLIKRARAVGCKTLILTVDLQLLAQRHNDIRNGLSSPPKLTFKNIVNMGLHPAWCWRMINTKRRSFANIIGHTSNVSDNTKLSSWINEQFDLKLSWNDIKRFRDIWDGNLVIKGIMHPEDAIFAVEAGADAIIVSNHGGRQLDQTSSTINVLPEIVNVVNKKTEVWFDGGIQSGQSLLKAIALGARIGLIGKSYLYGLAAGGEQGVTRCLEIIKKELDLTMALCGCRDINQVNNTIIKKQKYQ